MGKIKGRENFKGSSQKFNNKRGGACLVLSATGEILSHSHNLIDIFYYKIILIKITWIKSFKPPLLLGIIILRGKSTKITVKTINNSDNDFAKLCVEFLVIGYLMKMKQ